MFRTIDVSTCTILAKTNILFDNALIFKHLSPLAVEIDGQEWMKQKEHERDELMRANNLCEGSILNIKMGDKFAGTQFERKKQSKGTHFRNCISIKMVLKDKDIHFKAFKNGTFKLTGCKNDSQAEKAVVEYIKILKKVEKDSRGLVLYTVDQEADPEFIFKTVMINIRYKLGFEVNREKLDRLIEGMSDDNVEFYSNFEPTINSSVNIKSPTTEKLKELKCIMLNGDKVIHATRPHESYPDKKKYSEHTFLVFHSGVVIQSGNNYEEMEKKYNRFIDVVTSHRKEIEA